MADAYGSLSRLCLDNDDNGTQSTIAWVNWQRGTRCTILPLAQDVKKFVMVNKLCKSNSIDHVDCVTWPCVTCKSKNFYDWNEYCQVIEYLNIYVPRVMDELPIRQSRSQPVNPSHVTINGLAHYCTHNASVNNSI